MTPEVWEDLVLTEYDLSRPDVLTAVETLAHGDTTSPAQYQDGWTATNTPARIVRDPERIAELAERLDDGLRRWLDAVAALRRLDQRPYPPPVTGGREL